MNRKANPYVAIIAALVLVVILLVCNGCGNSTAAQTEGERFTVEGVGSDDMLITSIDAYIVTDTETGVQYLYVYNYRGGGLTVMQPSAD